MQIEFNRDEMLRFDEMVERLGIEEASKRREKEETEFHIRSILTTIGENPEREGLFDTPKRVAKMYKEVFGGYGIDPSALLQSATFAADGVVEDGVNFEQGMVIVRNISYYSHCEHHMVPFFGKVSVGYIPKGKVVGLSKIARVVDAFARRLQIQERFTKQIADCIWETLEPQGVMVIADGQHLCMKMRGVKNPCADTVTSCVRGVFEKLEVRQEFLQLVKG